MDILKILDKRIEEEKENASFKERIFFDFLIGSKFELGIENAKSKMDKICFAAFEQNSENVSHLLKQQQGIKEIGGLHYRNNIIELLAMGLLDFSYEKDSLKSYSENSSLKESYLISVVLPDIQIPSDFSIRDNIDKLVREIFINSTYKNLGKGIVKAMNDASDLKDLYLIKISLEKALNLHPNKKLENENIKLVALFKKLRIYYENRLRNKYQFLFFILTTFLITGISYIIVEFWDPWGLEPYLAAMPIVSIILSLFFSIIINKKIPTFKSWFEKFISERAIRKLIRRGIYPTSFEEIEKNNLILSKTAHPPSDSAHQSKNKTP